MAQAQKLTTGVSLLRGHSDGSEQHVKLCFKQFDDGRSATVTTWLCPRQRTTNMLKYCHRIELEAHKSKLRQAKADHVAVSPAGDLSVDLSRSKQLLHRAAVPVETVAPPQYHWKPIAQAVVLVSQSVTVSLKQLSKTISSQIMLPGLVLLLPTFLHPELVAHGRQPSTDTAKDNLQAATQKHKAVQPCVLTEKMCF